MGQGAETPDKGAERICPGGGRSLQRKVAYLFSYRNGIRERSVGVLRCYGTGEAPEVTLEVYREAERKRAWRLYSINRYEGLTEAAFLWELTAKRGRSEVGHRQCRLCAEVADGNGILLLPETVAAARTEQIDWPDTREFLCARYDGREMTEKQLHDAFRRRQGSETGERLCMQSAKRLLEEITKAAGGDCPQELSEKDTVERQEAKRKEVSLLLREKAKYNRISCLEELLLSKPSYMPWREGNVGYTVRITPEDLLLLPKEGRNYAENSYLLHGYYRYRHVLLGRGPGAAGAEYLILVPGRYDRKEARLAGIFGFPEFLPVLPEVRTVASAEESFGYWCGKI